MVKKFLLCLLLVIALTAILAVAAMAEPLPADIQNYFNDKSGSQILANMNVTGDTYMVLVRNGNTNTVYCFKLKNGTWQHSFHATKAVPQGNNNMDMQVFSEHYEPSNGKTYNGPLVMFAKFNSSNNYYDQAVFYQLSNSGVWNLCLIIDNTKKADSIDVGKDYLDFFFYDGTNMDHTKVRGSFKRDMRYVSLESFPMTVQDAKKGLTFAPDMPVNSELQATEVEFTGGKKYPVYSGPSDKTIRGANNKASVSTNSWIQVFGRENGWILIQYSIDTSHYRFGYIEESSLPKNAVVGNLGFNRRDAVIQSNVNVTDDPLYSQNVLATVSAGENVVWLANMGSWAYIEGANYRGFVPASAIAAANETPVADNSAFLTYTDAAGVDYNLFEIRKLQYDAAHQVYAVTGSFERVVEDEYPTDEKAENGKLFTYNLADNFTALVPDSLSAENINLVTVNDLYQWYIDCYMDGEEPEGQMVFMCDYPEDQWSEVDADFWFVTTRIQLNSQNEIEYLEYVYVPWG